jgi:hypothetical protein
MGYSFLGHERLFIWAEGFPAGDMYYCLEAPVFYAAVQSCLVCLRRLNLFCKAIDSRGVQIQSNPTLASVTSGESRAVPSS